MATWLIIFTAALVFAIGGTPVARFIALRVGIVDQPTLRKIHSRPMPLLGGLAIYGAFLIALLLFADRFYVSQTIGIVIGATWVSFLGVWDDRVGLNAWVKLVGQILGALILVVSGISVDLIHQPMLDVVITVLWIVGITNAMNLLDNMDGLSGGVAAIAASFNLLIAALNGQYLVGSLSAAMLGASLGFLIYNFNPASIFMGDSGSMFLGFMLAAVGIKLRFTGHPLIFTWFIPILVLGLPIFDTTLVCISRLRRGLNPLTHPGTDHLSHRLRVRGLTARSTILVLYLTAGACGVLALLCAAHAGIENYAALAAAGIAGLVALWMFELNTYKES